MAKITEKMDKFENLFNRLLRKPLLSSHEMDYVSIYSACSKNKDLVYKAYDKYIAAELRLKKMQTQFHKTLTY
jgi:hypothetical protein